MCHPRKKCLRIFRKQSWIGGDVYYYAWTKVKGIEKETQNSNTKKAC